MNIKLEILKRIKEEIINDPYHLGYFKMTDEQIRNTLNSNFAIMTSSEIIMPPPINRILAGLESAPNVICDTQDILNAKAFISTEV